MMTGQEERTALRAACLRFKDPKRSCDRGVNAAARLLGVSSTTMRRWLRGHSRIPRSTTPWLESQAYAIAQAKARE